MICDNYYNMTKNDIRFFNMAKEASINNDSTIKIKIGAVAVLNNRVISIGSNSYKTSPIQARYARYRNDIKHEDIQYKIHLHAEIDCLRKIANMNLPWNKVKIYVYRPMKVREFGIARPCNSCMHYIKDLGIKHVYYTTDMGYSHEVIL